MPKALYAYAGAPALSFKYMYLIFKKRRCKHNCCSSHTSPETASVHLFSFSILDAQIIYKEKRPTISEILGALLNIHLILFLNMRTGQNTLYQTGE